MEALATAGGGAPLRPIVDADTHVDESDHTWAFLDPAHRGLRPVTLGAGEASQGGSGRSPQYWLIDGTVRARRVRDDVRTGTTRQTRELIDPAARLVDMDDMGVDVQVIYPTLFLTAVTDRADVEVALYRAYNRWLADRCASSGGRLRWVALLPVRDVDASIAEIDFARTHGACAVLRKGIDVGGRTAGDPYFWPIYAAAEEADLAVCFHIGSGDPNLSDLTPRFEALSHTILPVVDACADLLLGQVPDRFPTLRFGFIEAGAMWVPFILSDLRAKQDRTARAGIDATRELFRNARLYAAVQEHEDIAYLLELGLEDSLVIGTDYSHADQSASREAIWTLTDGAVGRALGPSVVSKIVSDNPCRLYGIGGVARPTPAVVADTQLLTDG